MSTATTDRPLRLALRLVGLERLASALGHGAESAGPRADVAQDHEGGGALGPALQTIRASCRLTHRLQPELGDEVGGLPVAAARLAGSWWD